MTTNRTSEAYLRHQEALRSLLYATFSPTPAPNVGDVWAKALKQLTHYTDETLTPLLCNLLQQYIEWEGVVAKPQLWKIHIALSKTLCAFPPDALTLFWLKMDSPTVTERPALDYGLELLSAGHACTHLIVGLETCKTHAPRQKIVSALEKVGDQHVLPALAQAYRKAGEHDWTLARYMERAFRAIHYRTRQAEERTLLRASEMPASELLHAMSTPYYDVTNLLQPPQEIPNEQTRNDS